MDKHFASLDLRVEHTNLHVQRSALFQVFWFTEGAGRLVVDFKSYVVAPNFLFFVSAGQLYEFRLVQPVRGQLITFNADFLYTRGTEITFLSRCNILDATNNQLYVQLQADELPVFQSLFYLLRREYEQPVTHFRDEILHNHLLSVILHAEQLRIQRGGAYLPVDDDCRIYMRFRDVLEENYKQDKQVGAYSESLHLPAKKLNRAVQRTSGKSTSQVITERVVLEAKRLLRHSALSIKEIAGELGFEEPSYFSKVFKKVTQQTPEQFRREQHESYP